MNTIISIAQIVVSIAIIVLILLQQRDSDSAGFLGGGGGGGGGFYQQRRGLESAFFNLTIALVVIFACLAMLNLFITPDVVSVTPVPVENASSTI